jgi:hypothetical protein
MQALGKAIKGKKQRKMNLDWMANLMKIGKKSTKPKSSPNKRVDLAGNH